MDKLVIVLGDDLSPGLAANAAAALAFSAAYLFPEGVGPDLRDASGSLHPGITAVGLPILRAPAEDLGALREAAAGDPEIRCLDFSETARLSRSYAAYAEALALLPSGELRYRALCLVGPRAAVARHTGSLPLF